MNHSWRYSILKPEQSNKHKNGRMKLWNYPSNLIYQIADFFLIGPVLPATLFLFPILPMSLFFLNTCFLIRAFFLQTHQRRVFAWQLGSYSWVEVWDTLGAYIKCSLAFLPVCTHTSMGSISPSQARLNTSTSSVQLASSFRDRFQLWPLPPISKLINHCPRCSEYHKNLWGLLLLLLSHWRWIDRLIVPVQRGYRFCTYVSEGKNTIPVFQN